MIRSDTYSDYRQRTLALANGANLHEINGLLGIVMNEISNIEYWETHDDALSKIDLGKCQRRYSKAIEEINLVLCCK